MSEVHVNKNTYTVDPLYQWDVNQTLTVYGLSLSRLPEIHFTNEAMDRAIVRQATMNTSGVISAEVPNSLMQKPYKITAYICTYEGETFKTLYKIDIPITKRTKPGDYTLVDDPEVYSFNALENKVENALIDYNKSVQNYNAAAQALNDAAALYKRDMPVIEASLARSEAAAEAVEDKVDKVEGAPEGNLAALDAAGNLVDSGVSASFVLNATRVGVVSYVGTGTYGKDNPCSLTFDFVPRLILYAGKESGTGYQENNYEDHNIMFCENLPTEYDPSLLNYIGFNGENSANTSRRMAKKSLDGRTVYWYADFTEGNSSAPINQLNVIGTTYYFVGIG